MLQMYRLGQQILVWHLLYMQMHSSAYSESQAGKKYKYKHQA